MILFRFSNLGPTESAVTFNGDVKTTRTEGSHLFNNLSEKLLAVIGDLVFASPAADDVGQLATAFRYLSEYYVVFTSLITPGKVEGVEVKNFINAEGKIYRAAQNLTDIFQAAFAQLAPVAPVEITKTLETQLTFDGREAFKT